jgi:hypothetical protein
MILVTHRMTTAPRNGTPEASEGRSASPRLVCRLYLTSYSYSYVHSGLSVENPDRAPGGRGIIRDILKKAAELVKNDSSAVSVSLTTILVGLP